MNKTAMSPTQVALYSLLAGGGAFGGLKLIQDIMTAYDPSKMQEAEKRRQLPVYIPSGEPTVGTNMSSAPEAGGGTSIPQLKTASGSVWSGFFDPNFLKHLVTGSPELRPEVQQQAMRMPGADVTLGATALNSHAATGGGNTGGGDLLKKLLLGGVGLGGGFLGAKALYDKYRASQMESELDKVKKRYTQALEQAKIQKTSSTPCLDGFCKQIEELSKTAGPLDAFTDPGLNLLKEYLLPFIGISALGTGGYLINSDLKRRKAEEKKRFPEDVVLTNPMMR